MNDKSPQQLFRREELIYLSPDSPHVLTDLNPEVVYVIGGLVDETVKRLPSDYGQGISQIYITIQCVISHSRLNPSTGASLGFH
ncbi:tRNA methyltransferase 10 homolog A-like [Tachypleus tridentatus]